MPLRFVVATEAKGEADLLALGIRMQWIGSEVAVARSAAELAALPALDGADLIVVGLERDGEEIATLCRRLRQHSESGIVVLLTSGAVLDRIRALDSGADVCLTRPIDVTELLSWARALLRRIPLTGSRDVQQTDHAGPVYQVDEVDLTPDAAELGANGSSDVAGPFLVRGALVVDTIKRQAHLGGSPVALTSTEYRLLEVLARHTGRVLSHKFLLEQVWGPEYVGEDRYLKVFVRRLRNKLNDNSQRPRFIDTEWGIGYRFMPQSHYTVTDGAAVPMAQAVE